MTMKLTMQRMMMGEVEHEVKVTRIKGHGYGVRVLVNGEINQEDLAETRQDIGPVARSMLRMEDKCGNISKHADRARHRVGEKEIARQHQIEQA
jgi:hypothetical protein